MRLVPEVSVSEPENGAERGESAKSFGTSSICAAVEVGKKCREPVNPRVPRIDVFGVWLPTLDDFRTQHVMLT